MLPILRRTLVVGLACGAVTTVAVFANRVWSAASYLTGLQETTPAVRAEPPESVLCGPRSLWLAARRLGLPLDRKVINDIPVDPQTGASVGDLRDACIRNGMNAESKRVAWSELRSHPGTAILHVRSDHFFAVDPRETPPTAEPDSIRIYDPSRVAAWWTRSELEAVWDGVTILLSRPESSISAQARAAWQTSWEDVGLLHEADNTRAVFRVRNEGREPLSLKIGKTSCNCTIAKISAGQLAPQETAVVEMEVNLKQKRGPFFESVVIETNDPESPSVNLFFTGAVINTEVVSARKVHWGATRVGQPIRPHFFLHDPGDGRLELLSAHWVGDEPTADRATIAAKVHVEKVKLGSQYIGKVGRFSVTPGDYRVEVEINSLLDSKFGAAGGVVELTTNLSGKHAKIPVRVEGQILSDIDVNPGAVLLCPTGDRTAVVRLTGFNNRVVNVKETVITGGVPVTVERVHQVAPDIVEITVSCESKLSTGGEAAIGCQLQSGRQVTIPVVVVPPTQPPAGGREATR